MGLGCANNVISRLDGQQVGTERNVQGKLKRLHCPTRVGTIMNQRLIAELRAGPYTSPRLRLDVVSEQKVDCEMLRFGGQMHVEQVSTDINTATCASSQLH